MRAEQAWATFTLLFALCAIAVAAVFVSLGYHPYEVGAFGVCVFAIYLYVVYKRYHIELVTEGDIALFNDPEDLKILCEIYGLGGTGRPLVDRQRLKNFVRDHPRTPFVWTAPHGVRSVSSALSMPEPPQEEEELTVPKLMKKLMADAPSDASLKGSLIWDADGRAGTPALAKKCPVCEAPLGGRKDLCPECGADLRFYSSLTYSRLGRRIIAEKTGARKRKHR